MEKKLFYASYARQNAVVGTYITASQNVRPQFLYIVVYVILKTQAKLRDHKLQLRQNSTYPLTFSVVVDLSIISLILLLDSAIGSTQLQGRVQLVRVPVISFHFV